MKSRTSGTFLVTRTRSIRPGRGRTGRPWPDSGRLPAGTRRCTIKQNWSAWGKPWYSTKAELQMVRKLIGSCMNIDLSLKKMVLHRQVLYIPFLDFLLPNSQPFSSRSSIFIKTTSLIRDLKIDFSTLEVTEIYGSNPSTWSFVFWNFSHDNLRTHFPPN